MRKRYTFIFILIGVAIMIFASKTASYYFTVSSGIDPLSKKAALLTLLFMLFFLLGSMLTAGILLVHERSHNK